MPDTSPPPPPPDRTLYLIDGHAQIFRAFFAIRSAMTSPVTGEPTNATFAFTNLLLKLFEQLSPKYVAMAIDMGGSEKRSALYPDYKANRETTPDGLEAQVPRILEITRLFGIPILGIQGEEADDIMATIVERLTHDETHRDLHIRLVSKDKDLQQLLSERVEMYDIQTDTYIDLETLKKEKGVTPEQVVDLLALMGDNVDNIPGVNGIGPKTAAQLIEKHGSIEGIFDAIDEQTPKRRENLLAAKEFLPTARTLVTLDRDVPIDFELDKARVDAINGDALTNVFKQLGFRRHITDLNRLLERDKHLDADRANSAGDGITGSLFGDVDDDRAAVHLDAGPSSDAATAAYETITTAEQLADLVKTLERQKVIAFDTETMGHGPRAGMCGLSLAWKSGHGIYIPTVSPDPARHLDEKTVVMALQEVLGDEKIEKVAQNAKFDLQVLRRAGGEVRGLTFDTMIAGYLLGLPGVGLDAMALNVLNHQNIPITQVIGPGGRQGKQKNMHEVAVEVVAPYAAEDADITLRLRDALKPKLEALGMTTLMEEVEMPLVRVLADMEEAGIRVDAEVLDRQREALQLRFDELREVIRQAAEEGPELNLGSTKQLRVVLFEKLGFPVVKRTKTGPSTDVEVLEKLKDKAEHDELKSVPEAARAIPSLLLEYRQLEKLIGTYLQSLVDAIDAEDGRIHCSFNQTVAATGRLSSSDPNLQNIPIRTELGREIRKAFVAEPGHRLIAADYSQIELRMLAHLSEDEALIAAFRDDEDIHRTVAAKVFNTSPAEVTPDQRASAKVVNFGIIYGVTAWGLARRIDGLDVEAAETLIADYKAGFPGIDRFLARCVQQAETQGYVSTILGRRRAIEQVLSRNPNQRALGERLAINTVIQGSAADLIKVAMIRLHRRLREQELDARILLQIHDELILEATEADAERASELMRETMEGAMDLKVPLGVETGVGKSWFECK